MDPNLSELVLDWEWEREGESLFLLCETINFKRPPFILVKGQLRELTKQLESIQEQLRQKDGQLRLMRFCRYVRCG